MKPRLVPGALIVLFVAMSMTSSVARGQQLPSCLRGRGSASCLRAFQGRAAGPGSADKHVVDAAAADRGKKIWAGECISCHGTQARGTDSGPNLVQSVIVLHDRYGSDLGPFLRKGHPTQSREPSASFSDPQIADLSHFIHQRVYETLRSSPTFVVQDILTGDPGAGAKYFNGEGRCVTCHSPTGDLAGIGGRYAPPVLQQRFIFPRSGRGGRPVTVTVTPSGGAPMSGVLAQMDDFTVSLRDASGAYHSWKRTPDLTVVKNDPYAAHIELLDRITDKNMHDVVAYLASLSRVQ
ncbi:MAG: c-type cytochrome [Acidobacteria bacterium]|nr:c-type cytochrome [Acidobacteriota bacterium]MBI3261672.1 c-type cytochrome [Acidobacteriota bacterium]